MKQANPDIKIIARTYTHDCVPTWMLSDASAWWDQIKYILPSGFDYYEIENECAPADGDYERWAYFSIDMAQLVYRDKGGALLAFSFGPGWPKYELFGALAPYFTWVSNNPLPDGRYHGAAFHGAAWATFNRGDSPWINNPHITPGRLDYLRYELINGGGPDLKTWPGEIWYTELGLTDGYSGNWNVSYSCAEKADAYHTTDEKLEEQGMASGVTWWNFGLLGRWSDDSACSPLFWP